MTHALSAALLHFVWQGLAVTILLWLALFAMRRRAASLRYAVSCGAMALLVLLPGLTTWILYSAGSVGFSRRATSVPLAPLSVAPLTSFDFLALLQSWAVPVWACGVLIFSLRMIWGCTRVAALRRDGAPADPPLSTTFTALATRMGVTRPVRLLLATVTDSPSVTGWLRPVVLLPITAATGLTPDQLEAVLAHELAHIRRHDYLVNLLQMATETLLFYHPAVWWISSRIRQERELCCDDLAVRTTGGAMEYARALTALEKMRMARPAMALGSTDGPLFHRIRRLVMGGNEYGPSKLSGAVALALSVVCVALCVNWARGQEPARDGVTVNTPGSVLLHRTAVQYPQSLREKGVQGTVSVEVTLDSAGEVTDARIVSGPEELRKPVLASVLNWHFRPDGAATRVVDITFGSGALPRKPEPAVAASASPAGEKPRVERAVVVTTRGPDGEPQVLLHAQLEAEVARQSTVRALGREIEARRANLAALQNTYGPNYPEILQRRKEIAELESRLQVAQRAAEEQVGVATQSTNARIEEVKNQMAELHSEIVAMRNRSDTPPAELSLRETQLQRLQELLAELSPQPLAGRNLAGRKLAAIEIRGLSDEAAADLLSRLPVHEGDTLTTESMQSTERTARQFDSHLEVSFGGEPEGAFLRIHPAGAADSPLLRRK